MSYAIGIDLGGTNLKGALVHREEGLLQQDSIPTEADKGPDHVLDRLASLSRMLIQEAPNGVAGVGMGAPGAINWERTTVSHPPNLPGWKVVNVSDRLREKLDMDLPVVVGNDANVAGLGSAHYSVGRPHPSFIMVTLGTGVGGAIIYQNSIFRGSTGGAAEIGHMTIDYEGPHDRHSIAGAIEGYLGREFLSHHARYQLMAQTDSLVHDMTGEDLEGLTPRTLYEAATEGDEPARKVLAWAGHKLGCALASAVNLLDIRTIVVGGGVSGAGDFILEPARQTLPQYVTVGLRDDLQILRETRGNDVGMLGAAHLIFEHRSD